MTKLLSIVWVSAIVLTVTYFEFLQPTNKTLLERERDSIKGVYEKWKEKEKIRREIELMQDEMYEDSIKKTKDSIFYDRIRRIDSMRRKRRAAE